MIWLMRCVSVAIFATFLCHEQKFTPYLQELWTFLKTNPLFQTVYFETWYVTVLYTFLVWIPGIWDYIPYLDRYKIEPSVKYEHPTKSQVVWEACLP